MEEGIVKNEITKKALFLLIYCKRKRMYVKAEQYGFTHPKVIAHSQHLDSLLNKYQGISS